jgi:hypothetical protein
MNTNFRSIFLLLICGFLVVPEVQAQRPLKKLRFKARGSIAITWLAAFLLAACCAASAETNPEQGLPFEIYALASLIGSADATPTVVDQIQSPSASWDPTGRAFGFRSGFALHKKNAALVGDVGFHRHQDHTGSTSLTTFMVGPRVSSTEHLRTKFYTDILAGAYRWNEQSVDANFTHGKFILSGGGGVDVRLTHRLAFRVLALELMLVGSQNGPLLNSRVSSGLVYRFGGAKSVQRSRAVQKTHAAGGIKP